MVFVSGGEIGGGAGKARSAEHDPRALATPLPVIELQVLSQEC
jgi:hypothetical protein